MRVLVIDSHKGTCAPTDNLHWQNAKDIADIFGGKLIWSYPGVNDQIIAGFDAIIFVHASHYAYTDYAWISESPNAKLFYVTNEYNLGEPRTLWTAAKEGRRYEVIANHSPNISKVVTKYVDEWHRVNLNALSYKPNVIRGNLDLFKSEGKGTVYYGSWRSDRADSFSRWLSDGSVTISTHPKNQDKFRNVGVTGPFVHRLFLDRGDLRHFEASLYIEDNTTHANFNEMANRFYEALRDNVKPVFSDCCEGTVDRAGYCGALILNSPKNLDSISDWEIPAQWHEQASADKARAVSSIARIVQGGKP